MTKHSPPIVSGPARECLAEVAAAAAAMVVTLGHVDETLLAVDTALASMIHAPGGQRASGIPLRYLDAVPAGASQKERVMR